MQVKKVLEELKEQEQKKARAERSFNDKKKTLRDLNKIPQENSVENVQINYDIEKHLTKTLQSGIL